MVFGRVGAVGSDAGGGLSAEALRPIDKETVLPAARGRILARDGTVLACDETIRAVAVEYRWLQDPPDERWLRNMVRARLPKADRKNAEKLAAEKAKVLAERAELAQRLARLVRPFARAMGRPDAEESRPASNALPTSANRRRQSAAAQPETADDSWAARIRRLLLDDPPPPRIIVAEELALTSWPTTCRRRSCRRSRPRRSLSRHEDRGAFAADVSRKARWPPTCSGIWGQERSG